MTTFKLDSRHEDSSLWIADLELSQLRLFNQKKLLWLLLIPKVSHVTEIYELDHKQQLQLMHEINQISQLLKKHFPCDKLNIASLGNIVPQLHVHIIARTKYDAFWPDAPFGLSAHPYVASDAEQLMEKIRALL